MGKRDKRLNQVTVTGKRFIRSADRVLAQIEELEREMIAGAKGLEKFLSAGFSWAFLYELPFQQMQLLMLASLGALDEFLAAARSADPQEAMLALLEAEGLDEREWQGGAGGVFEEQDVIALVIVACRSVKSLALYGAYMSELVERIRKGSEKAFLDALHIDPSVIACPSVASFAATWLAKAQLLGRTQARSRFVSAMKGRPPTTLRGHRKLRLTLQYMKETGLMKPASIDPATIELIQQLGVYSTSAGAERSLAQFVRRWQAEQAAT